MQQDTSHRFFDHLLAIGLMTGAAVFITWPLVARLDGAVVGYAYGFEDATQNVWNVWWVHYALVHRLNPFYTPLLYAPAGLQLYFQTLCLPGVLPGLPAAFIAGPVAGYNSALLIATMLCGYGAFCLARAYVPGRAIPLLCGLLFLAAPFHQMKIAVNQLNLISMQWLPFYALALLQLERRRRRRTALLCAALFLLITLTDWYWALAAALYTAVWAMVQIWSVRPRGTTLLRIALLAALVVMVHLPLLLILAGVRDQIPTSDTGAWREYVRGFSADALGLFFPSALHPLWGATVSRWAEDIAAGSFALEGYYVALGWTLLIGAASGAWRGGAASRPFVILFLAGWLFSLGPSLRILGRDTGLILPYALLENLPLISNGRRPSHYALICLVAALPLAALGFEALLKGLPKTRRGLLLLGIGAAATLELWPLSNDGARSITIQPELAVLANRPGIVVDLPFEWQETSRSLRNQLGHGQPILGGYVARRPAAGALKYHPWYRQIIEMKVLEDPIIGLDDGLRAAMQCATPISHVLIDTTAVSPAQLKSLNTALGRQLPTGSASFTTTTGTAVYQLTSEQSACRPFLYPGAGWHELENDGEKAWRWSDGRGDLYLVNPQATAVTAVLLLKSFAYLEAQPARLINGRTGDVLASWLIEPRPRSYRLPVTLPPGTTTFQLVSEAQAEPGTSGRRMIGIAISGAELRYTGSPSP